MFRLPKEVIHSIRDFKDALKDFKDGRMSPDRFKGIRVPWGIYSQRGGEIFMARVRIPAGVVTSKQVRVLADCSLKYGNGVLHVTTRQDIQIHDVKIEDTEELIEYLKEFDLSPRGGGGNTVRNITSCPLAGVCGKEAFDVRSYAISLTEFLLPDPDSYRLPRKYKIAFSGCGEDCALATLADLGFIAKERVIDNKKALGFSVYAGGGMGAKSRVGQLLEEFILPRDVGHVAEAIKRVFFKHGERRNRHRARLRFLVERLGFEEFKGLYEEERERLKDTVYIALRKISFPYPEDVAGELPVSTDGEFETFKSHNVSPQRQKGYFTMGVKLPLGDIPADKLIGLAETAEEFKAIEFRTAQDQNIYICNVRANWVYPLYERLKEMNLASPYMSTIFDPVSCQGATTCNLGLCNSKGLADHLIEVLRKDGLNPEPLGEFNIRISGCPNSCGQHPSGVIGLHGLVRRVGARPVPFYRILLGGRVEEGKTRLAQNVGIVPARNIPFVLKEFLTLSQERVKRYGDVYEYLEGEGNELMEQVMEEHSYVPAYEEDVTFYRDFGKDEDFTLAGIGPGECGAGVLDLIESDLEDAHRKLALADERGYDVQLLSEPLHLSARALLVVRGIEPKSPEEAIESFIKEFVQTGIASERFRDLKERFLSLERVKDAQERGELSLYAKDFHQEVKGLYASMDSSFDFPRRARPEKRGEERHEVLDLRGTPCPINFVKTKLALEDLESGELLEVWLDEGEPIRNVPPSVKEEGHKILKLERVGEYHRLVIEKA